jgi:hypothetical protein
MNDNYIGNCSQINTTIVESAIVNTDEINEKTEGNGIVILNQYSINDGGLSLNHKDISQTDDIQCNSLSLNNADKITIDTDVEITGTLNAPTLSTLNITAYSITESEEGQGVNIAGTNNFYGDNVQLQSIQIQNNEISSLTDNTVKIMSDLNMNSKDINNVNIIRSSNYVEAPLMYANTINEYTANDGVTVMNNNGFYNDHVKLQDVIVTGNTITSNSEDNSINMNTDVTITGNLDVQGTTTTVNSETVAIEDNLILINSNQTGTPSSLLLGGLEIERGDQTNYQFVFRESDDAFCVGMVGDLQKVATRQDTPTTNGFAYWNASENRFDKYSDKSRAWSNRDELKSLALSSVGRM